MVFRLLAVLIVLSLSSSPSEAGETEAPAEPLTFTHALDDSPLDVLTPRPGETFTAEVEQFHVTGDNPYRGDEAAIADGRALYNRWCQACHLPDGSGRIGPRLTDDDWVRPRAATDKGMFEVIFGGAAGAMQAFSVRMDQDEILRLMAFLDTLRAQ